MGQTFTLYTDLLHDVVDQGAHLSLALVGSETGESGLSGLSTRVCLACPTVMSMWATYEKAREKGVTKRKQ